MSLVASASGRRVVNSSRLALGLLAAAVSGGGIVAYADSKPDTSTECVTKKKVVVLGSGWAGFSFLKKLDSSLYDVKVISPSNYFLFTPLLPSVTCGVVEPRSIIEPIRKLVQKKKLDIHFYEGECYKIDPTSKKVYCRSDFGTNLDGTSEFEVNYDYLVIAVGAKVNTFGTPGVNEFCYFLKEIQDAQRIRQSVIDCFERATLPCISDEEKKKILHFAIIGGGPTGVEFAAELHDFVVEDLVNLYPAVQDFVKISLIQSGAHILNMFDQRISEFAEDKFKRDGIELKTGFKVVKVSKDAVTMKDASNEELSMPYGMAVWCAGLGTRPVILDLMQQIGQANRRVLATDEWLRVKGCDGVFAVGDCATINQSKVMDGIEAIFKLADKDNSGVLTWQELREVYNDIIVRYPQVDFYVRSMHRTDIVDLIKNTVSDANREEKIIHFEEFKAIMSHVDSQIKSLPATAQVAAQQGEYLASCFNKTKECEEHPEGPLRIGKPGRHHFVPFRYKHLGQFAPLGGEQAAAELPGDWVSMGHSTQWLWYSVYASKQVSWRTRMLVVSDWTRRFLFGRDTSRI